MIKQSAVRDNKVGLRYAESDWFMTITRNMPFWHQYLSNEGHFYHTKDFGVSARLRILHITKNGTETSVFMCNPNYSDYAAAVLKKVSTKNGVVDLKKRYRNHAKKLLFSLTSAKNNLTVKSFGKFLDEYKIFTAGLMITATLGRSGADKLIEKLKFLGYKEEEISKINASITYPKEHTPLFVSQLDLLKIGIAIQAGRLKEKALEKALSKWLLKHEYIPVNFCENPWSFNDVKKQFDCFLKKNCKKEHEKAKKNHIEAVKKGKQFLKKIGDRDVVILANAIAEGTYLNEFRKNIFSKVSLEYRSIFRKIAEKSGSKNWRDCFYLTPTEMSSVLSGVKINIRAIVKKRAVAGICVDLQGCSHLLDKNTVNRFYLYISKIQGASKEAFGEKIIKGSSASMGKVIGIARLILSSKDFDKLNPGDILVTTMTSVDFVPVMERAAAFVTNEGGITSHASIVAREMNKPCIIGTKNATQIIKDGDMVEVDADKGIVKIIK